MLVKKPILDAIARGDVTLAFRSWRRPTVKSGSRLRTAVGVIPIEAVEAVSENGITNADALAAGYPNREALLSELRREPGRDIYRVTLGPPEADHRLALRDQSTLSEDEAETLLARFRHLEKKRTGRYRDTLEIIKDNPATRAGDLAAALDCDKLVFKRDVRKLKELGLTESLDVGYRLSERGKTLLRMIDDA